MLKQFLFVTEAVIFSNKHITYISWASDVATAQWFYMRNKQLLQIIKPAFLVYVPVIIIIVIIIIIIIVAAAALVQFCEERYT